MSGQKRTSGQPVSQVVWGGLQALSVALHHAADVERPAGDFAIEIQSLREIGLSDSDLRWLVCKGYVQHFIDKSRFDQPGRLVVSTESLRFVAESCFALTPTGIAIVASCESDARQVGDGQEFSGTASDVPFWDTKSRVLHLGADVVAIFESRAPAQERILAAFEEEAWPARIDDPLTPNGEGDRKTRLNKTIHRLNKHLNSSDIHFCCDGSGLGVCWHRNRAADCRSCSSECQ